MIVLVQSSLHTTWGSLFEMELKPNSLDWNINELEHEHKLEDMKRTNITVQSTLYVFMDSKLLALLHSIPS